ncbi:unnamed protein product [Closterium sp. NIES-64]|nr:unnamed protein product [Closterium sp. NIES-64]
MGKPKAKPIATGAGKGKTSATRRVSSTASRPSNAGRMRLLIQGQGGPAERTLQAASLPQARARVLHQGRQGQDRSRGDNAASPLLLPLPPTAPTVPSPQRRDSGAPNTHGAGPGRTTAKSDTSPRALRAARRGVASQQQEQRQHEGLAGWEGTAALGELAADAAGAGAAETGLAAAANAAEAEGAALLEETDAAAAAEGTRMAQEGTQTAGTVGGVSAAETAAASDGGLTSPAVSAASPSPLGTAEVAAVVVEAGRRQQLPPNEETAPPAAWAGGTSAGAGGANMHGHGRAGSGRPVPGTGVASCAARGKKLRAQPAPRRPGAGLGPGVPGPLLGWLLQGQSPQGPARPPPSHVEAAVATSTAQTTTQAAPTQAPGNQVRATNGAPAVTDTTAAAAGSNVAAAAVETRRSARLGAITWGPPRGGRTPWMPVGRGGNGAVEMAGAAGRGQRGVLRGGMRGGRGGRNQQPRLEIPVRTGPWRERHARPERAIPQTNEG